MKKNTKILLGVGALAVVGYLIWKNNQGKKANATGMCPKGSKETIINSKGQIIVRCDNTKTGSVVAYDDKGNQIYK